VNRRAGCWTLLWRLLLEVKVCHSERSRLPSRSPASAGRRLKEWSEWGERHGRLRRKGSGESVGR
jgi:hypothetical protein